MDEMDFYLSRCVKNWAASHCPPAGGRIRLLRAAASPPVQRERQLVRFLSYLKTLVSVGPDIYYEGEIYLGPITQSRAWSYHFATNIRLAN